MLTPEILQLSFSLGGDVRSSSIRPSFINKLGYAPLAIAFHIHIQLDHYPLLLCVSGFYHENPNIMNSLRPRPYRFPNLLINRLVLNLRTFQRPRYGRKTTTPKLLDDLAFATNRVLGNIGAPLDPDQWDEEYIEDNEDLESEVLGEVTDQQLGEEEVQDVALESLAARDFSVSSLSPGARSILG